MKKVTLILMALVLGFAGSAFGWSIDIVNTVNSGVAGGAIQYQLVQNGNSADDGDMLTDVRLALAYDNSELENYSTTYSAAIQSLFVVSSPDSMDWENGWDVIMPVWVTAGSPAGVNVTDGTVYATLDFTLAAGAVIDGEVDLKWNSGDMENYYTWNMNQIRRAGKDVLAGYAECAPYLGGEGLDHGVPVPSAIFLLASGIAGLVAIRRK